MKNVSLWADTSTTAGSWIWRKLLKLRDLVAPFLKAEVNNGKTTSFWFDNWSPLGRLIDITRPVGPRNLGIHINASVSNAATDTEWRIRRTRSRQYPEIIDQIFALPVPSIEKGPDMYLWRHHSDTYKDNFSSSHTWNQLRNHSPLVPWSHVVWLSEGIPRCAFITWLAISDRLSTGARMRTWGRNQSCTLCGDTNETRDHLFFACPFSYSVWSDLCSGLLGTRINPCWSTTLASLIGRTTNRQRDILLRIGFQVTIYSLWRERNCCEFTRTIISPLTS